MKINKTQKKRRRKNRKLKSLLVKLRSGGIPNIKVQN